MSTTETLPQRGSRFLWIYLILFGVLGLGYSILTPVFENSDETLHYPYVKHLADGQGLPLAIPNQLWNQEGTQPPLYYAVVAASTFWIDTDNLPELLQRNPHWLFTEVRALINDNQNLVLHGPMDALPYQGTALAVQIGRWWSLVFGMLTIVFTYLIARQLFPTSLPLILTATALTALNPQLMRVSATVSNDSLSAALASLTVLLALKFSEPTGRPTHHLTRPLLLGLLCGLAILTKLSSLSILLLVAFIVFWRSFFLSEVHQRPLQKLIHWLVIIGVTAMIVTGWWFFRNYQLYGEWFATETHLNLAGRSPLTLAEAWGLRAEAERAYWATFGWGQIRPPEWVYRLLFLLTRIGLIGLLVALVAKLIQGNKGKPLPLNLKEIRFEKIIILLLWAVMSLVLYLRWVMEVGSVSHTRLIFPAITAISLLIALGWHALIPCRLAACFTGLVTVFLVALNVYALGWLIYPAFTPNSTQAAAPTGANLTFLDSLTLVSTEVYPRNTSPASPKPDRKAGQGDVVMVKATWQPLAPLDKNYSVSIVLLAPDGTVLARRETYPGLGLRPTRYLETGSSFVDVYPLKLEIEVTEPMVARAAITLFDFDSDTRVGFPAFDETDNEVTPLVGKVKIVPQIWPEYNPQHVAKVNFNNALKLVGYDLSQTTSSTQPSNHLTNRPTGQLTLYWESLAPVNQDYVVFVHLLDAAGNVITQADAPPTNNAYPTSWWAPSELIADTHTLPATAGAVAIRFGLYDLNTGQRLPIIESSLPGQDNSVEVALP